MRITTGSSRPPASGPPAALDSAGAPRGTALSPWVAVVGLAHFSQVNGDLGRLDISQPAQLTWSSPARSQPTGSQPTRP